MANDRDLSRKQIFLLAQAAKSESGRFKMSARSLDRRSADALERRGLLTLVSADNYIATFEITDAGRAEHERQETPQAASSERAPLIDVTANLHIPM